MTDPRDGLEAENEKLRAVLQRVRRWGSPMVRGYIDGALGGSNRVRGVVCDDEGGEVAAQEKEK